MTLEKFGKMLLSFFILFMIAIIGYWIYLPIDHTLIREDQLRNFILISLTAVFILLVIKKQLKDNGIKIKISKILLIIYTCFISFYAGYFAYLAWLPGYYKPYTNTHSFQFACYILIKISVLLFLIWVLHTTFSESIKIIRKKK